MVDIVLVEPEIPNNTGAIARTCACTGSRLHLVKPLGFDISDRAVKRAGLDQLDVPSEDALQIGRHVDAGRLTDRNRSNPVRHERASFHASGGREPMPCRTSMEP